LGLLEAGGSTVKDLQSDSSAAGRSGETGAGRRTADTAVEAAAEVLVGGAAVTARAQVRSLHAVTTTIESSHDFRRAGRRGTGFFSALFLNIAAQLSNQGKHEISASRTLETFHKGNGGYPLLSLTVVICGYTMQRWTDICRAIESLQTQTRRPDQVVFVSDHNVELLARVTERYPQLTALASDGAPGLSGARNTGVGAAHCDLVAFLDDDAFADPAWAQQLIDAYSPAAPGPGAAGAVIGVGGSVSPNWVDHAPRWLPPEFRWVVGCSYTGQPTTRAQIRNPIGANMSFRKDVFDRVGGFDASVGRIGKDAGGCEETEFSIRAAAAFPGAQIVLEPGARCFHSVPAERCTKRYFRKRCAAEGRSKAIVSQLSGSAAALASERHYVTRTLPGGVLRGLADLLRGDRFGALRAIAILEGLTVTTWHYGLTRLRLRFGR
jgi:GT2 family glycosyltransferase